MAVMVNDRTAELYVDPVVMNNSTVGPKTGSDSQWLSSTMGKTNGEVGFETGGDELSVVVHHHFVMSY